MSCVQRSKANQDLKKGLQAKLQEMIEDEEAVKEISGTVREEMKKHSLPEHEVIVMVSHRPGTRCPSTRSSSW